MRKLAIAAAAAAALAAGGVHAQTRGVTDTEVRVGGAHDMSGIFAGFSVPAVKAAQLYFDELNAKGGVHGRQIRYIVEDHGYQVPKAVQAVNKLVNRDEVFAMLLSLGTPHNIAAFNVLDPLGIPNISPLTAARQMLQDPIENKFTGLSSYYDGIRAAAGYLMEKNGRKTVCSMYIPSDFGEEIHSATVDEAQARGLTFKAETQHRPDETDFTGAIGKLKAEGCDLVSIALGLRATITAVGTAKKMGWTDADFLVSSAGFHTAVAKVPGGVTEGLYAGAGWQDLEARLSNPAVADWVAKWKAATGEDLPGTGALLGRTAAEVFVRALEAAGPDLTLDGFKKAMSTLKYEEEIGGYTVDYTDGSHIGSSDIYISQVQNGSWALIGEVQAK
ncbi:ABC transporter substrate-binding protein [Futiania mangrovi]|uniref:ABC transporter substrate-binding protein n=1 Tax=Futiania mangrovi TaxID=2959716 RepID=A0A9J6PGL5_9PROT|nr:ABC transporter substrate-binding protein [Futiania mangrovii]MCP1336947.1 ABC transporter substrate-binding protein [Futiania mangrovii]